MIENDFADVSDRPDLLFAYYSRIHGKKNPTV